MTSADAPPSGYPTIAGSGMDGSDSMAPSAPPPPPAPPANAIVVTFNDEKAILDVSAAVTVSDVQHTLLSVFHQPAHTRIILRRPDGAVVVPGPTLSPGEYVLQEIETPWKVAYKNLRDKHYPSAKKQVQEKHIPYVVTTSKAGAANVQTALAKAHETSRGALSTAGGHISKYTGVAGQHINRQLTSAGTVVKGHVRRATGVANSHANTNSHTWTAKMWAGLCTCAPGPISFLTGVPVEELPTNRPITDTPSATGDTVPLSKNAETTSTYAPIS